MKHLLLVEDNELNVRLANAILRSRYRVTTVARAEEVTSVIESDRPDLILMDIQLPGASGLDLTKELRGVPEYAGIPIVAVTAYAMVGDRDKALAAGCDEYVSKPYDRKQLLEIIERYLSPASTHV